MLLYTAAEEIYTEAGVLKEDLPKMTFNVIEKALKKYKSHRSVADMNHSF